MLDHLTIRVSDLEKSKLFYDQVLAVLGMKIVLGQEGRFWGWGEGEHPEFELSVPEESDPPHRRVHIAFRAKNKEQVDAFYQVALEAGATTNGEPGPRPDYSDTYYAAFVRDRDGNNVEVCVY
ncbi:MAG: VOC family protein [Candidatus Doudnabacteria bacterium]|nr:VOC family protein [Candidatus Doudnabacteria bacterium]MCA9387496.1 VOC family protein [Candidatus Andersenbacteria bacterium]